MYVLKLQCVDRPGIVANVTAALFECGGNITEAQQFNDDISGHFFMRVSFEMKGGAAAETELRRRLGESATRFSMVWRLVLESAPTRTVIMVSQQDHCLQDLLYKTWVGDINLDVRAVVSNHPKGENLPLADKIAFHHLPITPATKVEQEARVRAIVEKEQAELVILARYMQILTEEMSAWLAGRCINIHHSFLPGFKGAKPYHQAYERGVKVIGATAHYVTSDLDEGPIIAQDVEVVSHVQGPAQLAATGRDIERRVLSRAVKWHTEHRVFVHQRRTVVFN